MATEKQDYYDILGVSKNSSPEEIKRAYRNLARRYHPDVNKAPDAESRFKEINEAYEVLSDDSKRRTYDRFGHAGVSGDGGAAGFGPGFGGLGDIFDVFFGMGGARPQSGFSAERGDDMRLDLDLTFEEAALGTTKTIHFTRQSACDICQGTGAKPGTHIDACPTCRGTGYVRHSQNTILGSFTTTTPCSRCRGQGQVIGSPCQKCQGSGRTRMNEKREIQIPAGVDHGSRIRLPGDGDAGLRGGEPGDLYVVLIVKPHEHFERRGNDIYLEMPVSFARAALGGAVEVPTLYGIETINLPEGTQNGASFRLRDKGVPDLNGHGRGDQFVVVRIAVPTKLTADQKFLLRQFANSLGEELENGERGIWNRLFHNEKN